jgi:RsiW-degrading membrane proteinase PrsW (M82 family)
MTNQSVETSANQMDTPVPTFHRWRWLWVWLLLVATAGLIAIYAANTLNTTAVPAMLLFGALSGPIAFSTFVGDRADIQGAIPLFNLVMIVLFGGAIGLLVGGALDSWLVGTPSSATIWWVGPAEESAKLILPVALYIFGHKKYRSVRAGLVLGLASAAGFAVMETMGYGLNEILKAGALFTAEAPLQGADRLEVAKDFVAGFRTPIVRGLTTPFGHIAWTGLVTTVWWSEWHKHGGIRITRSVIGAFVLVMLLHSTNDFVEITVGQIDASLWTVVLLLAIPVIFILTFVLFWRTVKKRVPMQKRT